MPNCPICGRSGLIPFVKDGKVIENAFQDCECKLDLARESYHPIKVEDFDYPVSDTFRDYSFEYCGAIDPGAQIPTTIEVVREVIRAPVRRQLPKPVAQAEQKVYKDITV